MRRLHHKATIVAGASYRVPGRGLRPRPQGTTMGAGDRPGHLPAVSRGGRRPRCAKPSAKLWKPAGTS